MAADAYEGSVLQHLKQLGLDGQIEAADLIEEQSSQMGLFYASEFCGHCAR